MLALRNTTFLINLSYGHQQSKVSVIIQKRINKHNRFSRGIIFFLRLFNRNCLSNFHVMIIIEISVRWQSLYFLEFTAAIAAAFFVHLK